MPSAYRARGAFIFEAALQHEATRRRTSLERLLETLLAGDATAHADLRVSLARMLHLALRPHPDVRSLNVFGSSLQEARPASDLDLLVHVADPDCPVVRALQRLNREISSAYRARFGRLVPRDFELLQVHVVTDAEVAAREGFAAILSSIHEERLCLGASGS